MKWMKRLAISMGVIYILGCGVLYAIQDKFLFKPERLSADTTFRFGEPISIPVGDEVALHGLLHHEDDSQGVILYLHGNRGNARWCQRQAETFTGFGYDVLLVDYRGYGLSEGEIDNSDQLYSDVQKVYDFLKTRYDESDIVLAGYSLGTGMASYLAAHNHPKQLLLIAPYVSITDMKDRIFPFIPDFLVRFPLDNEAHLGELTCPVVIFHGTDDEVIPYDSSVDLKAEFPDKIKLITLPNTGHRRAIFHEKIREELNSIL